MMSRPKKEGKMLKKAIYALTEAGEREFQRLMLEIASQPINIFLDFNAVIVNLQSLPEDEQWQCLENIKKNAADMKARLEENLDRKESAAGIPATGMAVLRQQHALIQTIEAWIESMSCV